MRFLRGTKEGRRFAVRHPILTTCAIAVLVGVSAPSIGNAQAKDSTGNKGKTDKLQVGDVPWNCGAQMVIPRYREAVQADTSLSGRIVSRDTIIPSTIRTSIAWSFIQIEGYDSLVYPDTKRIKGSPEDTIYFLKGWVYEIIRDTDDHAYHVLLCDRQAFDCGNFAEAVVTVENCALQHRLEGLVLERGLKFERRLLYYTGWDSVYTRDSRVRLDSSFHCVIEGPGFHYCHPLGDLSPGVRENYMPSMCTWQICPVRNIVFDKGEPPPELYK
jgi:hypothetical protein